MQALPTGGEGQVAPAGLIEEITQQLQEAGLSVDAPFGPYRGWAEMLVYREMEQDPTGIHLASERDGHHQLCHKLLALPCVEIHPGSRANGL
jgi:hypothetical protein